MYEGLRGDEFRELYRSGLVRILRGLDKKSRRVIILTPKNYAPDMVDTDLLLRWCAAPRAAYSSHATVSALPWPSAAHSSRLHAMPSLLLRAPL